MRFARPTSLVFVSVFAGLARAGFSEFCLPRVNWWVQRRGGTRRRGGCAARWGRLPRAIFRRSRPRRSSASASATARSSAARLTGSTRAPSRRQALLMFVICPVRSRRRRHCVVTVAVVPRACVRAGGREHGGGLRAAGRRRGAVGVPVLRERAQLPGGGAGDRPAVLRGLRFGAGSCRNQWGGAPPLGFACSCSNLSPHPCFLHTLSRVARVTLMCLFAFLGAGREERQGGELRPRTEVVR